MSTLPKILVVALVAIRVCVLAERFLFRAFRYDKCPGIELMNFEDTSINVNVCVMRCRAMTDCSGVCYRQEDGSCRFFFNKPIAAILNMTQEAPGYTMWWKDYPKNGFQFKMQGYYVLEGTYNWDTGMALCKDLKASLPVPKSVEEDDFIYSFTKTRVWLGIQDKLVEGHYIAAEDGSDITHFYWGSGNPNNYNNEDCVEKHDGSYIGKWNDLSCTGTIGIVCSMDMSKCSAADPLPLCFVTDAE